MSEFELPTPDETWPESAIDAYRILADLVQKQQETIQVLEERLKLNS